MVVNGCIALVTGANRGLGKVFVEALLAADASRVYAGARQPFQPIDARVIPLKEASQTLPPQQYFFATAGDG